MNLINSPINARSDSRYGTAVNLAVDLRYDDYNHLPISNEIRISWVYRIVKSVRATVKLDVKNIICTYLTAMAMFQYLSHKMIK